MNEYSLNIRKCARHGDYFRQTDKVNLTYTIYIAKMSLVMNKPMQKEVE